MVKEYPFSDNDMDFNKEEMRYVLTQEYVRKAKNIDLSKILDTSLCSNPEEAAQNFLDEISDDIYSFVYEHNTNNDLQQYLMAAEPFLRKIIKNAMLQQVLYVLVNGSLSKYSGVNLKNNSRLEQKFITDAAIAPKAKKELFKEIPGYGFSICFQGKIYSTKRYPAIGGGLLD